MDRSQAHFPTSGAPDLAVACVFIPHFPLRVEILRHPELDGLPLALTDLAGMARRKIIACSPEAAERGVRIGMSLRDAVNACSQAAILTSDPVYYAGVFADLLRSLGAVSPGIEAGEPGCAFVDLRGLGRLHGGLENVPAALLQAVPPTLRPRIGLAANKFTAWVAAHKARPGGSHAVPAEYGKAFLARCPVDLLPVPVETKRRLERFGLYTLGDIARLPAGKTQAQFGPEGRRIWELANGNDREPFRSIQHEERVLECLPLPSPAVQIETVLMGVWQLTRRIYARPDVRGRGARQARLQLLLEGQRSWERTIALKGTVGDAESLSTTLRYRLAGLTLDGAVEEITLELSGLTNVYARQEELFGVSLRRRQQQRVSEAVKQLKQRYGATPLYRVIPIEPWSRIPERRWGLFGYE
ncbi:MAG TPA: DNA polymerase Y family protein [Thermomicrobiales bacterium]|nr:DNA polymerase Y family protein [Thermomicrobiales bacterium]